MRVTRFLQRSFSSKVLKSKKIVLEQHKLAKGAKFQ